jgi:hypothetical protein
MFSSRSAITRSNSSRLSFFLAILVSSDNPQDVQRPCLDIGERFEYSDDVVAAERRFMSWAASAPGHLKMLALLNGPGKMSSRDLSLN